MKNYVLLTALMLTALGGCAYNASADHKYAGGTGSTYDAALNPPQARGVVTYDVGMPLVPHDYGNGSAGTETR